MNTPQYAIDSTLPPHHQLATTCQAYRFFVGRNIFSTQEFKEILVADKFHGNKLTTFCFVCEGCAHIFGQDRTVTNSPHFQDPRAIAIQTLCLMHHNIIVCEPPQMTPLQQWRSNPKLASEMYTKFSSKSILLRGVDREEMAESSPPPEAVPSEEAPPGPSEDTSEDVISSTCDEGFTPVHTVELNQPPVEEHLPTSCANPSKSSKRRLRRRRLQDFFRTTFQAPAFFKPIFVLSGQFCGTHRQTPDSPRRVSRPDSNPPSEAERFEFEPILRDIFAGNFKWSIDPLWLQRQSPSQARILSFMLHNVRIQAVVRGPEKSLATSSSAYSAIMKT